MDGLLVNNVILILLLVIVGGGVFLGFIMKKASPKKRLILDKLDMLRALSSINATSEAELRDLVIRADNITADSFHSYFGNSGTFGDNLKKAKYLFTSIEYNKIWDAHKIRNKVVHEQYAPNKSEVSELLYTFAKAVGKLL
ncbi:hypothetical protein H6763_00830 [Candidatus Nomurabacteria bacterium]|uniref:Uncharacterized protein n=1 Tax=Candidatus Dojkabacteria bacterium TaxID=2099670 RepID=A0A955I1Y6_9BACT|nr:hypothetical protein [Candidatus Dojkabacteria bacterium]MCB9803353.1 hypothetical protein [Candidatus Nomurabacteria bacterium]